MDSFSPLAAARMLVQVLPVGAVTAHRFDDALNSLKAAEAIKLSDIPPPAGGEQGD
jgi:hypothetical protein